MRRLTIAYTAVAIWAFGWLTGTFGFGPALLASIILLTPAYFGWRMAAARQDDVRDREYVYLGVLTLFSVTGTLLLITAWFDTGMDRRAMFNRALSDFRQHVATMPEYGNVTISYTDLKGGGLRLDGSVANEEAHERFLRTLERMVGFTGVWYDDDIYYPGRADSEAGHNDAPFYQ